MEKEGEFRRIGSLNKPPPTLLHALQSMKTRHITDGDKLSESLLMMFEKKPRIKDISIYQGLERDQLFKATYDHKGGETCNNCDINRVVRKPRDVSHVTTFLSL